MTKLRHTLAVSSIALALAACGASETEAPVTETDTSTTETTTPPAETETAGSEIDTVDVGPAPIEVAVIEQIIDAPDDATPGAHVHGLGELSAVVEDDTLTISFRSPMYNIVGFERPAENETEEAALEAAKATLRTGEGLFALEGDAGCDLVEVRVSYIRGGHSHAEGDHDHDDHDHGEDEHDHDHSEDDHDHSDDDHDHSHDDHDHGESLGDVEADYIYSCSSIDGLDAIDVNMFERFERFEEISGIALGDGTKTASLSPNRNRLEMPG